MCRKIVLLAFTMYYLMLLACKQHGEKAPAPASNDIIIGKTESIYSKILGEQRKIWVYVPNSFHFSRFTAQKQYPVAYLLDGDAHFFSFTGMVEQLSEENNNHICPDMIIVGVLNTDRTRDLTPEVDTTLHETTGGGKKFAAFLQQELMPYINNKYHPAPYNLLIGHSYGGLTALHILAEKPEMFQAVIAIDPSLAWNMGTVKRNIANKLAQIQLTTSSFFIGIANTMNSDMSIKIILTDTNRENAHMRANLEFVEMLRQLHLKDLRWDYNYYDDEDHYSVNTRTMYDALHFIFRDYPFTAKNRLLDTAINAEGAVSMLSLHFSHVSSSLGYPVKPPEKLVYGLAEQCIRLGQTNKGLALLQLNVHNYPDGASVYRELANYYKKIDSNVKFIFYQTIADSLNRTN